MSLRRRCIHQCDETQGNNSTQALSTKYSEYISLDLFCQPHEQLFTHSSEGEFLQWKKKTSVNVILAHIDVDGDVKLARHTLVSFFFSSRPTIPGKWLCYRCWWPSALLWDQDVVRTRVPYSSASGLKLGTQFPKLGWGWGVGRGCSSLPLSPSSSPPHPPPPPTLSRAHYFTILREAVHTQMMKPSNGQKKRGCSSLPLSPVIPYNERTISLKSTFSHNRFKPTTEQNKKALCLCYSYSCNLQGSLTDIQVNSFGIYLSGRSVFQPSHP